MTMHADAAGTSRSSSTVSIVLEIAARRSDDTTVSTLSCADVGGSVAIVLGATTAGADGNVSSIRLPGGIGTMISGIGVYEPDRSRSLKRALWLR